MGKPRNTQKYPTYPEIPEIPGNTRKKKRYPEIPDRKFQHTYPTRTRPATRCFVQYPTRPDPILKNPTRWTLSLGGVKHLSVHKNWVSIDWISMHGWSQGQVCNYLWLRMTSRRLRDQSNLRFSWSWSHYAVHTIVLWWSHYAAA